MAVDIKERAAGASLRDIGGIHDTGQGIAVDDPAHGADDTIRDGQAQTEWISEGINRVAGPEVFGTGQLQGGERGSFHAVLGGLGDFNQRDIDLVVIINDPFGLIDLPGDEGRGDVRASSIVW